MIVAFSDAADSTVTCAYNRSKTDFSEEKRLTMNFASEHLRIALQNARKIEQLYKAESNLNAALEAKSGGVIVLNSNRQIICESQFARLMLEKYFAAEKPKSGILPDSLLRWLNNECGKCLMIKFHRHDHTKLKGKIQNSRSV